MSVTRSVISSLVDDYESVYEVRRCQLQLHLFSIPGMDRRQVPLLLMIIRIVFRRRGEYCIVYDLYSCPAEYLNDDLDFVCENCTSHRVLGICSLSDGHLHVCD